MKRYSIQLSSDEFAVDALKTGRTVLSHFEWLQRLFDGVLAQGRPISSAGQTEVEWDLHDQNVKVAKKSDFEDIKSLLQAKQVLVHDARGALQELLDGSSPTAKMILCSKEDWSHFSWRFERISDAKWPLRIPRKDLEEVDELLSCVHEEPAFDPEQIEQSWVIATPEGPRITNWGIRARTFLPIPSVGVPWNDDDDKVKEVVGGSGVPGLVAPVLPPPGGPAHPYKEPLGTAPGVSTIPLSAVDKRGTRWKWLLWLLLFLLVLASLWWLFFRIVRVPYESGITTFGAPAPADLERQTVRPYSGRADFFGSPAPSFPGHFGDEDDGRPISPALANRFGGPSPTHMQVDADGDGFIDVEDNCRSTPNSNQHDLDGDGVGDACDPDMDSDGVVNEQDNCVRLTNPDQVDRDADGFGDSCDNCPQIRNPDQKNLDADRLGDACDPDIDGDLVLNEQDRCPEVVGPTRNDGCPDRIATHGDPDRDGIFNDEDNCPSTPNSNQHDLDGDGVGDACDPDIDGDRIENDADNCEWIVNPEQLDRDGDGVGDSCDKCLRTPNPVQADLDGDGKGDACDPDIDGDLVLSAQDNCVRLANPVQRDSDGDRFGDPCDNCPDTANPTQADMDGDRLGDACDPDIDGDGNVNAEDNCPKKKNEDQADDDGDNIGDVCDNCPQLYNPGQEDLCSDPDDPDGDGVMDPWDNCPSVPNPDRVDEDKDGVGDVCDNCPDDSNSDQSDRDGDGRGNLCDNCPEIYNPLQMDINANGIGDRCEDPQGDVPPGKKNGVLHSSLENPGGDWRPNFEHVPGLCVTGKQGNENILSCPPSLDFLKIENLQSGMRFTLPSEWSSAPITLRDGLTGELFGHQHPLGTLMADANHPGTWFLELKNGMTGAGYPEGLQIEALIEMPKGGYLSVFEVTSNDGVILHTHSTEKLDNVSWVGVASPKRGPMPLPGRLLWKWNSSDAKPAGWFSETRVLETPTGPSSYWMFTMPGNGLPPEGVSVETYLEDQVNKEQIRQKPYFSIPTSAEDE